MVVCEFCQAELPEHAVFCGQCGRQVGIAGETSISPVTTQGLIIPVLNNWTMPATGQTPYPTEPEPLQKIWSGEQRPFIRQDGGIDQTIPAADENNQDDEEDGARVLPFFPMAPATGNVPMVQGVPQPEGVPFVHNTPQIAGKLGQAAHTAFSGPPPSYTQPAYPFSPPPTPPMPNYSPQPPSPRRLRLPRTFRPTCLVIIAFVLIATSIIIGFTQIFFPHGSVTPSSPSVGLAGTPAPGQSIILYGNNFSPGETVIISIDTQLQTSTRNGSLGSFSQSMNIVAADYVLPQTQKTTPLLRYMTTVTSKGTFSKPIHIDASWRIGSTHTAYVYKQNGKLIKPLDFQIRSTLPTAHPGLLGCANQPASIVIGSAREATRQPASKTITLCTKGSGVVHWTATWNQKWLQLDRSGQIQAPRSAQILVNASALSLKHGMYRTSVVFTSQQSNAKIIINITFIVSQAPQPQPQANVQCISTDPQALYFNSEPGQNNTLLQWITIGNCGDTGHWSAIAPTNDGGHWLGLTSSSGTLQRGGIVDVTITANSARLSNGTYTGRIAFHLGSSTANVNIILTVHQSTCLNISRPALAFAGVAGESDLSSQEITLTNCGITGHWSTLISTDDGIDWLRLSSSSYNLPAGGQHQVSIIVSNALLDKGVYHGKITFVMGSVAVPIDVSLLISGACIQPLSPSLTFKSTGQQGDPSPQRITIVNCGDAAEQWFSSPATDNGANWLNIDPPNGYLQKYATASVFISVSTAHLTNGIYTGQILFGMGPVLVPVQVKLIIERGDQSTDCIMVSSDSLSFTSIEGQGNPDPQTLTILNCGKTTGQWFSSIAGDHDGKWLTIDLPKGTLGSGDTHVISVMPSSTLLSKGSYKAQITFGIGSSTGQVQVTLTVQPPPLVACINVNQSSLTFQMAGTSSTEANSIVIANPIPNEGSGPLKLNINNCGDEGTLSAAVSTVDGTNWLSTALTDENLKKDAQKSVLITATPTGLIAGTYTGTIAFTITTRTGTTDSATVNVTLNILPPSKNTSDCIKPSPSSLTFTSAWGQDNPPAQNIALTNCGSDTSWTESDNTDGSLYLSSVNGSLNHGDSQTISIQQINGQILPGTYTEPITFTTADGAIAIVNVTWNVKPPTSPICIEPSSTSLSFTMIEGANTGELVDYFSNCGIDAGQISVGKADNSNWLTVGSLSGSSTNNSYLTGDGPSITADVNDTNLQPGTYTDNINTIITTSGGSKQVAVGVTLLVLPQPSTPTDTGTPTATDTPTTSPTGQPMLLVSPTSFDPSSCPQNSDGSWTCTTTLSVDANSPGSVNWSASSRDLSGITFSPSNDLLYPGQQESVAIQVPGSTCSNGTFTFTTDAGVTSSASWSCTATPTAIPTDTPTATPTDTPTATPTSPTSQPAPQVSPTSFDSSTCTQNTDSSWTCSATLSLDASAQSSVNWSASSPDLSGITFSPANGTLTPGQQTPITITVPASDCSNGTFTFTTDSGATTSATWTCSASTPTITPTDTPTDTPTPTPTDTPTSVPTDTPTPVPTDTPTPVPTDTPTPVPTDTPTPVPTDTPTPGT